ncbi:MAG: iron ABC transporter permease [Deltaproteobacteria bacterium]|nr:iron ABC transporter permease [Deltaproteobacteria bacterium]
MTHSAKWPWRLSALALLTVLCFGFALRVGAASLDWSIALRDASSVHRAVMQARGARVILGALTGASLAAAGCAFQALLRNPLGDPFALGVSGGAALGATVVVLVGATAPFWLPLGAFVGALGAALAVVLLARLGGSMDARGMLLAGVVLNTATSAMLSLLRSALPGGRAERTLSLLLGTIGEESMGTVALVAGFAIPGWIALMILSKSMNLLSLGADSAASLGLSVRRAELWLFAVGSLVVGAVVSVCGLVPFVGLVAPHYARAWVGGDHRVLLPASALVGASLVLVADAGARGAYALLGTEVPVGALTALVGAPFLLVALRAKSHT